MKNIATKSNCVTALQKDISVLDGMSRIIQ